MRRRLWLWLWLPLAALSAGALLWRTLATPERRIVALLPAAQSDYKSGCRSELGVSQILHYGKRALPVLVEQLEHGDPAYREVEMYLLASFGPTAAAAVPRLKQLATAPAPVGADTRIAALRALAQIIPGDPCLLQYAETLARQGNTSAVYWLAHEDQASRAVLLKLIRSEPGSRQKLLRAWTDSGCAPLADIRDLLLAALAEDSQPQFTYLPAHDSSQPDADNRWAEEALDARPKERAAILRTWAADFEHQDRGVQLYLLKHLDECGMQLRALREYSQRCDSKLAGAIERVIAAAVQQQKAADFKALVASVRLDPYQGGIEKLTDYGAEGLAELHRLALLGDCQLGLTVIGTLNHAEGKLGPEVLDVYYDIVLRIRGRVCLDAVTKLEHYDADPQAYAALLTRLVHELPGVDQDKQGYLFGLYIANKYPRGPEPPHKRSYTQAEVCQSTSDAMAYYERIIAVDRHVIIGQLARAECDDISADHLQDCNNPGCPVRKRGRK